jgi:hypothetical protein
VSSKPNQKDKDKKFLQRIAGKPALGSPPTPRPLPKEHPARDMFRVAPEPSQQESEVQAHTPPVEIPESPPVKAEPSAPAQLEAAPVISEEIAVAASVPLPSLGAHGATSFDAFFAQWKDALHLHKGEIKVLRVLFSQTHELGKGECQTTQASLAASAQLKKRQCQNVVASLIKRGLIDKIDLENKDNNRGLIIRVHLRPYDHKPAF